MLSNNTSNYLFSQTDTTEKLSSAEQVLARYVEVTGGVEKYKAIKSMKQTGKLSLAGTGIEGEVETTILLPDRLLIKADIPGVANETQGILGDIVWSDSTMTGSRIVSDGEADQMRMELEIRRFYDPAAVHKSLEFVGESEINGETCYEIKITRQNGSIDHDYYSVETGLQVKSKSKSESVMGSIEIESFPAEYKEFNGMKFPTRVTQVLPNNLKMVITIESIDINQEIDPEIFELPDQIKRLVEKQVQDRDKQ
ncbi:MAG TPA: hypothetical protein PKD64_10560 [Pirellulaceae bacterium]|nr:hypothetical protein [Pirellulaceae bacterium]